MFFVKPQFFISIHKIDSNPADSQKAY